MVEGLKVLDKFIKKKKVLDKIYSKSIKNYK